MKVLETERLILRHLTVEDAEFFLELVNSPGWIANIGDRGLRSVGEAVRYIADVYAASYETKGFGLYLVESKETGESLGISGLIKRDSLPDVDIGFAFLERHWGRGYAVESAAGVLDYARNVLNIPRIVAITNQTNEASRRVLEKIGLKFERMIKLPEFETEERLFS